MTMTVEECCEAVCDCLRNGVVNAEGWDAHGYAIGGRLTAAAVAEINDLSRDFAAATGITYESARLALLRSRGPYPGEEC